MMKRLVICAVGFAILLCVVVVVQFSRRQERSESPTTTEHQSVPASQAPLAPRPPVTAPLTSSKGLGPNPFTGPASLVGTFRSLSAPLLQLGTVGTVEERLAMCRRVASALNRSVNPSALRSAAGAVHDPVLAELALDDRTARSNLLVACGRMDRRTTDDVLRTVKAIDAMINRRTGEHR